MPSFYSDSPEASLRFGDVVSGFTAVTPQVDEVHPGAFDFSLRISRHKFFVIMTPCCSIEDKVVAVAPLEKVRFAFFKTPYFATDLTRINHPNLPKDSIPPIAFERMPTLQKQQLLERPPVYTFLECFIYDAHDLLPEYEIKQSDKAYKTRHRMVDFKDIFKVECKHIIRDAAAPADSKILQLSIKSRDELRDKLLRYFGRRAEEDLVR